MANPASEKLLLAGMIRHTDAFYQYRQYLDTDDFSSAGARITFEALDALLADTDVAKISKAKLFSAAASIGHGNYLASTRDGSWVDEVLAENVAEREVAVHFQEVKKQSLIAAYMDATQKVRDYLNNTTDPLSTIISTVEDQVISQVSTLDRGENEIIHLTAGLRQFVEEMAKDPGQIGLDIGYPLWQARVGQIRNAAITFMVATAKAGKSQFGLRAAKEAAHRQNLPVLLMDSELNENDQKIRIAGMMAEVPYNIIETGYWQLSESQLRAEGIEDDQEIADILEYGRRLRTDALWEKVEALPIEYMKISGLSVADCIPHMRRWVLQKVKPDPKAKHAQCLIVYDYIKLSSLDEIGRGRVPEWQMHGLNVSSLHEFAKKYNVPVLAFGQTNNELDDGFRCVAGGKRISENVSSISYLKAKTQDERSFDGNGSHLIRVFATRFGRGTKDGYINYEADLRFGKFTELEVGTVDFGAEARRRAQRARDGKSEKEADDDDE